MLHTLFSRILTEENPDKSSFMVSLKYFQDEHIPTQVIVPVLPSMNTFILVYMYLYKLISCLNHSFLAEVCMGLSEITWQR